MYLQIQKRQERKRGDVFSRRFYVEVKKDDGIND